MGMTGAAFQKCINPDCGAEFDCGQALFKCPACGELLDTRYNWDKIEVPDKLSDLGKLHVVFSRKKGERRILGLVTDDPKLPVRQTIHAYDDRWSIEVFFKDGKQLLGLGQYQNVSYEAAVTHLHLVCFAYALLTHVAITREGAQGKQKSTARLSTADLQNEVRRMVWDEVSEHLKQFSSGTQIIKELERLLIAA